MKGFNKRFTGRKVPGLIAATIFIVTCGSASAQSAAPDAYNMIIIKDQSYGRAINAGNHMRAITRLENARAGFAKRFSVNTNLCVAYVLAKKIDEARTRCDLAVASKANPTKATGLAGTGTQDWAVALNNRGVLRALEGDHLGARGDFEKAINLHTGLKESKRNLIRLENKLIEISAALTSG